MNLPADLKHFKARVEEYREDHESLYTLGCVLSIVAIVMLTITLSTVVLQHNIIAQAHAEEKVQARDAAASSQSYALQAEHYASLVAGCMNGERIVWEDPHTGSDWMAVCEVVELGKVVQ